MTDSNKTSIAEILDKSGSVEAEGYLRCAKDISCIAAALGKRLEEEKPSEEGS